MKTPVVNEAPRYQTTTVTDKDAIERPVDRDEADMIRMGKTQQTGVSRSQLMRCFC